VVLLRCTVNRILSPNVLVYLWLKGQHLQNVDSFFYVYYFQEVLRHSTAGWLFYLTIITVFTRVIFTPFFFSSLAAEKSVCKIWGFSRFRTTKCPTVTFWIFLIILFVSSNNARWIPEFRILFVLCGSRTVPWNLSLLICTTLKESWQNFEEASGHCETGRGQQVAQLHERYMMMMTTIRVICALFFF
jgi:hypothetical protein